MHNQPPSETTFAVATLGCKVNQADSEAIGEQMSDAGFVQRDFNEIADVYIVNTCTVTHLGDRSSRQLISQARRRHPGALLVVTGCYAELNPTAVAALPGVDLVVGNTGKSSLVEAVKERWKAYSSRHSAEQISSSENQYPQQRHILPVLPLDTHHIGSDQSLLIDGESGQEPQPDNPPTFSPFTSRQTSLLASSNDRLTSRTRAQMKLQDCCNNRCTYCIVPYVRGGSRKIGRASCRER